MKSKLHWSLLVLLALEAAACGTLTDGGGASDPTSKRTGQGSGAQQGETSSFQPAGPQSYTPNAKPRGRERAVRQLWSSPIGRTDYRSTLLFADNAIWVGAKGSKSAPSGVYVIDGRTGARRAFFQAGRGDVIGIALNGERVYASSSGGEVTATTKDGRSIFRANIGAPIVTAPTLVSNVGSDGTTTVVDVVVGDAKGRVTLLDGGSGAIRWSRAMSPANEARPSIGNGLAAADLDGDGSKEIVGGTEAGRLFALRVRGGGELAWEVTRPSALRAAPLISDVDADKQLEVVAGWADGDVAIIDGKLGKEIWAAHVEEDNGDPTGLLASPTPLPGGSLLVPTARWGKEDSVVLLRAHDRAYRSKQGSVVASPVLATIQPGTSAVEAIVGTSLGDVVSFDAAGAMSFVYHIEGAVIEAPALIADIEGNGLQELVVATRDGRLVALAVHATTPPLAGLSRGSLHNDGVLPAIDLGWRLP